MTPKNISQHNFSLLLMTLSGAVPSQTVIRCRYCSATKSLCSKLQVYNTHFFFLTTHDKFKIKSGLECSDMRRGVRRGGCW